MATAISLSKIEEILGDRSGDLLGHKCGTVPADMLHVPGPRFVEEVWVGSDRSPRVLRALQSLFDHGRLAGTGYLSILPVDQGIEHTAGASFAPNPIYFDGEKIVELAIEGGCNAVASTFGVLGSVARRYAHRIPFIVKLNHNQLLTYPNEYDQIQFGTVREAWQMGAVAVGATIYFGSEQSSRQLVEIARAFHEAHELGMATILWCYLRNAAFVKEGVDYHLAADLTGQANHLGVTIEADIIKQKLPETNGGFNALKFGKTSAGRLRSTDHGSPDRPRPLPGRELLPGPLRADQLGRGLVRRGRPQGGGHHRGHQQTGRRYGPDLRPESLPAADGRWRRPAERDPGRLLEPGHHARLISPGRERRTAFGGLPAGR